MSGPESTVADHLRQWIAAARGAIEWHLETGDVDLPVPAEFVLPPLGDIAPPMAGSTAGGAWGRAGSAPQSSAPRASAPQASGPRASGPHASGPPASAPQAPPPQPGAPPGPRATAGGFARLAEAAGAQVSQMAGARRAARAAATATATTADAASTAATAADPGAPLEITDGPAAAAAGLRVLRDEIGDCRGCSLHQGRTELVFGAGHPRARVMFIADQPGPDDDQLGLPFVDGAGQLLGRMVRAMGLSRSQVYLTHLVKCHDPEQGPEPGLQACAGFLARQIALVQPEVIIALGGVAARQLSGVREQLPHLRGRWHEHAGVAVLATFHPNALAQHPQSKRQVWNDLKMAMRRLALPMPGRRG